MFLLHTLTTSCLIFKFFIMMFLMPSLALTLRTCMVLMESLLLFSKTVHLCLHLAWSHFSVSAYQLLSIFLAVPVPKKGDHFNPSNYRPNALISWLSKVSESLRNRKIQRHLSAHNLALLHIFLQAPKPETGK